MCLILYILTVHMQITLSRRRIRSTAFSHARLPGLRVFASTFHRRLSRLITNIYRDLLFHPSAASTMTALASLFLFERVRQAMRICSFIFSYASHSCYLFLHFIAAANYFAGNRYVLKGDTAVMLLFDSKGKIAGIQNGVMNTT